MRAFLLLFLAVSTSAHAQAVRPATVPVLRPPAYTPGYAPGTPPEPVYTPPGAGLSGERVPGTVAPPAPRSNSRILPRETDGAPGLWAADGAPHPATASRLFGVEIPLPADQGLAERINLTSACVAGLTNAMHEVAPHVMAYDHFIRACMAAQAYNRCTEFLRRTASQPSTRSMDQGWRPPVPTATMQAHAATLVKRWCTDVDLSGEPTDALERILTRWQWNRTNQD